MKQKSSRFSEKAVNYFKQDYNCAQSVLLTMQEYYGVQRDTLIPKIATAFGGGIGRRGSLCGALTGAIISVGLKHGTNSTSLKKKKESYKIAQQVYTRFIEECGSPFCRELIGYDLNDPEDVKAMHKMKVRDKKCTRFVRNAVEILIDLETKNQPKKNKKTKK